MQAQVLCFPESYIPGYRGIGEPVAAHSPAALEEASQRAREIARRHRIALILPMDRDHPRGIQNGALVISDSGEVLGFQTKNQLDPTEDETYVPGTQRQLFEVAGVQLGICICHEGFRYPESVRWAARRGAQVVFHPHCTGSNASGRRLSGWRAPENPYYEQAMMCRALENTVYFASVNYALAYQESASSVFGPQGEGIAHQPYGTPGVLVAELDLSRATRILARRWVPDLYR
jgi:5-aminopentanamidase